MGVMRWVNNVAIYNYFSKKKKENYGYKKKIAIKKLKEYLLLKFFLDISQLLSNRIIKTIIFSLKKISFQYRLKTRYNKVTNTNNLLSAFYLVINKFKIKDIICIERTSLYLFLVEEMLV